MFFMLFSSFVIPQDVEEISPQKAFEMLRNPSTYLIDVRSIAEYVFIEHPEMAANIPLMFWSEKKQKLIENTNFLQNVEPLFKKEDTLIFICRSGGRSLKAAKLAKNSGFCNVLSIEEGFEGKKDKKGLRTINGWKNRQLPYTYELNESLIYQPQTKSDPKKK